MIMRLAQAAARRRQRRVEPEDGLQPLEGLRAVLFDLDGTLVSSEAQIAEAAVAALKTFGYELDPQRILTALGPPLADLLAELLDLSETEAQAIYREFLRIYMERYVAETPPMPYAEPLLDLLRQRGVRLGVVTNKVEEGGRAVLEALDWASYFDVLIAADMVTQPKPAAEPALTALRALQVAPGDAALVGDSEADIGCGLSAGLRGVIGLTTTRPAATLARAGATHVCEDLVQVRTVLTGPE